MTNNEIVNNSVRESENKPVLLRMENIDKSFPGVKALDNVSLTVKAGTVHALMGENGAGKSTLMKCLFGVYAKDSGNIYLEGKEINFKNSKEALENGVAMVHQELNQALKRNVMDNMWLGRFPTVAKGVPITSEKKMYNATKEIFKKLEINVDPKTVMSRMPVSQRQMVEIAKAVSYNSKVIVFDEPTSSLTEEEVEHLFKIINMLRDQGCGIIYISHKMAEILRISDEVTIMRDGKWIATEQAKDLTTDDIIKLMVGRELTNLYPPKDNQIGDVLLDVKDLSAEYSKLSNVSFSARKGEIIGVAGLDGSGRTELLENLFGVATRRSGTLTLNGKPIKNRNSRESIKNGFALLTEERRATGIFGILNIRENAVISSLKKCQAGPFLSKTKMKKNTDWCINSMHIKTPTQETKIRSLSGGNQQKVILGRWLLTEPTVLLLDEPTRGIDVGAKYEIYELIIDLASKGKTVIMVSSEMPELLGVCDRILVMSGGKLAGEVDAKNTTQEEIMALAAKFA
ncbi:MAG: ATP-binding cassette domain-containing protein [Acutalibacteraceae bacterium]|nr:ATP-binding cassette domain-containing protein [Acutalibacteraceae bacterium]